MIATSGSLKTKSYWWLSVIAIVAFVLILVVSTKRLPVHSIATVPKKYKKQHLAIVRKDTANNFQLRSVIHSSFTGGKNKAEKTKTQVNKSIFSTYKPPVLTENNVSAIDTNNTIKKVEETTLNNISILENFFKSVAKRPVAFHISAQNDTTLFLPEGTIIHIAANTLAYADGTTVVGNVLLSATEFYDKADMVRSGLNTTSNTGDQLVTGGMLNITAKDDLGNELNVKNNATINVQMPFKTFDKDMQLFLPVKTTQPPVSKADSVMRMLQGFDWGVGGQHQAGMPVPMAHVVDWVHTEAYQDGYEGNKLKFVVDKKSTLSNQQVKKALEKQYPGYKIKVVRLWKHPVKFFNKSGAPTVGKIDTIALAKAKQLHMVSLDEEAQALLRFRQDLQHYKDDSVRFAAAAQVDSSYGFKISSLGFINCDRFYQDRREKIDYYVKENADKNPSVHRLFFHNINSVMAPSNGQSAFKKIPVGEKVTLVSVSVVGNEPVASFKTFYTNNENKRLEPEYHSTTPAAFQEDLQKFLATKL